MRDGVLRVYRVAREQWGSSQEAIAHLAPEERVKLWVILLLDEAEQRMVAAFRAWVDGMPPDSRIALGADDRRDLREMLSEYRERKAAVDRMVG
jgi:hypothetical protein